MHMLRSFYLLVGSSATAQVIFLIGTLLLARLYTPQAFGEYGFVASLAAFFSVVSGFRFDYLAFSPSSKAYEAEAFYFLSIILSGFLFFATVSIVTLVYLYESPRQSDQWVIPLYLLSVSLCFLGGQALLAKGEYALYARLRVFHAASQVLLGVLFFILSPKLGLILSAMIAQGVLGGWFIIKNIKSCNGPMIPFSELYIIWYKFKNWAFVNTITTALQYSAPLAPVLLGGYNYKSSEIGAYFVMSQMFAAPLGVLRRSLLSFLNSNISSPKVMVNILKLKKRVFWLSISAFLVVGAFVIAVLLYFFSEEIVVITIGKQWVYYSYLFLPLAGYFLFDSLLQPLSTLAPLWGWSRLALLFEGVRFCLVYGVGAVLIFIFQASFFQFIMFFISSMLFVYFLQLIHVLLVARTRYE